MSGGRNRSRNRSGTGRYRLRHVFLFFLAALVLASCSKNEPEPDQLSGVLKIAVMGKFSYYESVGKILPLHFPNVAFEILDVATGTPEQVADEIDALKPDIVAFLSPDFYIPMLERGSLLELDARIKQDAFDLEQMHAPIVQFLKDIGGGRVFGLAPVFTSNALFYNIELFDRYGVPYPTDGMSWEELYQLAARFPIGDTDTSVFGFQYKGTISDQLSLLARAEHLSYYDASLEHLQFNTEPWRQLFQSVLDWNKKGIVDTSTADSFIGGRAAMTLGDTSYLSTLREKGSGMKWSLVTVPSYSQDRGINHAISLNIIYSIHAQAASPDLAWQILKFINSDDMAKLQFQSLSAKTAYSKERDGVSLEPFYRLNIDTFGTYEYMRRREIHSKIASKLNQLINQKADAALKGTLSPSEALEQIQTEGQLLLLSTKTP